MIETSQKCILRQNETSKKKEEIVGYHLVNGFTAHVSDAKIYKRAIYSLICSSENT